MKRSIHAVVSTLVMLLAANAAHAAFDEPTIATSPFWYEISEEPADIAWQPGEWTAYRIVHITPAWQGENNTVGTLLKRVAAVTQSTVVINQDVVLMGDAASYTLTLDKHSGKVLEVTALNRKTRAVSTDKDVTERGEDRVAVPAGKFMSRHSVERVQDITVDTWRDPAHVAMGGGVRQVLTTRSPFGQDLTYEIQLVGQSRYPTDGTTP